MSPIELTRIWFQRVWNEGDESAIRKMMHPQAKISGLGLEQVGPEGFIPFQQAFINGFDNAHIELLEIYEQEDQCFGHGVFTGIHHVTQTPVTIEFSYSGRWENDRLIEAKNVVDYLPMLSQLQLFSQDILGQALKPKQENDV